MLHPIKNVCFVAKSLLSDPLTPWASGDGEKSTNTWAEGSKPEEEVQLSEIYIYID